MYRGYYYLEVSERYPKLFSHNEKDLIENWFVRITERTFTVEWSDIYYALAFRKPITAPYRNQENGTGALIVFAQIIKHKRPDLAKKAIDYVRNNAVMWKSNFRNTDDSISYQASWIYNCYNVARLAFPNWLTNSFSKKSFDWIKNQWPPDGSPLGYNPDPATMVPDIMYLGAHLHQDGTYEWLADRMMEYSTQHHRDLFGFRPGLAFNNQHVQGVKPSVGSVYMKGPGNLVQFPTEDRPDKIVFREGWEPDSFYALLNLRFDGWHGYKGTNSFVTIRYGEPFVVEDLVRTSWEWLPEGRAKRRDENICRTRLNGFQIEGGIGRKALNKFLGFKSSWEQDVPAYTKLDDFIASERIVYSKTNISNWHNWNNTRICLLLKDNYFLVFDFNWGDRKKRHAITWHLKGELNRAVNRVDLKGQNHEMSLYPFSDTARISLNDSSEIYPPQDEEFAAEHDLWMEAVSDYSEIGVLFWPKRRSQIFQISKIRDNSDYVMGVRLRTHRYEDVIFVRQREGVKIPIHQEIATDSDFVILRKTDNKQILYYEKDGVIKTHYP